MPHLLPSPQLLEVAIDENLVLMKPRDRQVHLLNGTACQIWETLKSGIDPAALLDAWVRNSPESARAKKDLQTLFGHWKTQGLLAEQMQSQQPYSQPTPTASCPCPDLHFSGGKHYALTDRILRIALFTANPNGFMPMP